MIDAIGAVGGFKFNKNGEWRSELILTLLPQVRFTLPMAKYKLHLIIIDAR